MAYKKLWWEFPESNEYEYKWEGNYGAKGEKRAPRRKATPEQIAKQNQRNREKKMRRLIKKNFRAGDLWCTLKYPKGTRLAAEKVKKDMKVFFDAMRKAYKAREEPFKYIYRLEVGKQGGIHIHLLCNRLTDKPVKGKPDTDTLIQRAWKPGRVNFESLYDAGGYQQLAEYIVKKPDKQTEKQLSMFPDAEQKEFLRYSSSRNLIRPVPEQKEYKRRTLKKLMENGPEPTPGYYIDKNSIRKGVNPYTGLSYYQYIEYRIRDGDGWSRADGEDKPPWEF
ncbi:MAG: hypothetical protein ACI4FZ_08875 [Lachnospiraceae bacterium]